MVSQEPTSRRSEVSVTYWSILTRRPSNVSILTKNVKLCASDCCLVSAFLKQWSGGLASPSNAARNRGK